MSYPYFDRRVDVCMIEEDLWDFGYGLQKEFPEACYYRELDPINRPDDARPTPVPPVVPLHRHFCEAKVNPRDLICMILAPFWRPNFYKNKRYLSDPDRWCWSILNDTYPTAHFRLSGGISEKPVPHPAWGDICFYGKKDDPTHHELMLRFFRVFRKFATDKKNLVRVRVPSLEVTVPVKQSGSWCGHRAIEWAREDPNRVLFYVNAGFGIRPTSKVVPFKPKKPKAGAKKAKG